MNAFKLTFIVLCFGTTITMSSKSFKNFEVLKTNAVAETPDSNYQVIEKVKKVKKADSLMQKKVSAIDSIIDKKLEDFSQKADQLVEKTVDQAVDGVTKIIRKTMIYIIVFVLILLGVPFYLGYLFGKRKSK